MFYTRISNKDNLDIIGIGGASYRYDENPIGGDLIFIKEANSSMASLVYWKTQQIQKVAHSSKDAETLNVSKLVDDAVYISRQVEMLLYGYIKGRIPVKLFTDSEPTLESITSSRQVKDKCFEGKVLSYVWLPTKEMIASPINRGNIGPLTDMQTYLHEMDRVK